MQKKKEGTTKVTEISAAESKQPEPKYKKADLIKGAARFGVKPEVVAGALAASKKEELTISEVEDAIKKFKERKV